MEDQTPRKEPESSFRGLYKNVKISVKTLDTVIIGGIVLMLLLVIFGIANNGYTVTFDSRGGTDVPMQTDLMYGDLVAEPEPPTREGYRFTGWYTDATCDILWNVEERTIETDMTLYAGWEKLE